MRNEFVGFTQGFHTESLAIIDANGDCVFYPSGFDHSIVTTDNIAFFERPWLKKTRQLYAGQFKTAFSPLNLKLKPKYHFSHHLCHAANAFQQSKLQDAHVVVADSIGEWDTISIWSAGYDQNGMVRYKKLNSRIYPFSLGLFYSSITQLVGFKPNAEENRLMESSANGFFDPTLYDSMFDQLVNRNNHRGCLGMYSNFSKENLAFNAQTVLEDFLISWFKLDTPNCFAGGVAYNKKAVDNIKNRGYDIYVPDHPGDPGSAIGAAALLYKKRIRTVVCR